MTDVQSRLNELRRRVRGLSPYSAPDDVAALEREARDLMADAKNTPYEEAARALFAELARRGKAQPTQTPADEASVQLRGLLRRARIRIEIAGDDDDIDDALDILAQVFAQQPDSAEAIELAQQAAAQSQAATQRVRDLFTRYNVSADVSPPTPEPPPPTLNEPSDDDVPAYPTSAGYPAPEENLPETNMPGTPGQGPLFSGGNVDAQLSEITSLYYAGDYQQTIDLANRVLSAQPGNPTALEYREKAE
ncbi:MAG: hypothetical protein AAF125_00675, partial [Chloroflexota bacterium]